MIENLTHELIGIKLSELILILKKDNLINIPLDTRHKISMVFELKEPNSADAIGADILIGEVKLTEV